MSEVRWSARANRALTRIYEFIAEREPAAARNVAARIVAAADRLGEYPTGRPGRVAGTYEKSLPDLHYILQYRVRAGGSAGEVFILDVKHARQDWNARDASR